MVPFLPKDSDRPAVWEDGKRALPVWWLLSDPGLLLSAGELWQQPSHGMPKLLPLEGHILQQLGRILLSAFLPDSVLLPGIKLYVRLLNEF